MTAHSVDMSLAVRKCCVGNYYFCARRCADKENCQLRSKDKRIPFSVFEAVGQSVELEYERKLQFQPIPVAHLTRVLRKWSKRALR